MKGPPEMGKGRRKERNKRTDKGGGRRDRLGNGGKSDDGNSTAGEGREQGRQCEE